MPQLLNTRQVLQPTKTVTKLHNTLEILNLIQCYWPLQKASWYTVIVYTVALIFYASVGWNGLSLLNVFFGITCIHIRYFYLPYLLAFHVISLVDFTFQFGEFQSIRHFEILQTKICRCRICLLTKKSNDKPLCGVLYIFGQSAIPPYSLTSDILRRL